MDQKGRRDYLIDRLCREAGEDERPGMSDGERRRFLRTLMNLRMPGPADKDFLEVQDEYLREANREKGIVHIEDIPNIRGRCGAECENAERIYLWQGDIIRLAVDAIVNAANSQMLGCFIPCHNCIDNCIHTYAGIQLRNCCAEIMKAQGHEEPAGNARITPGFNLPCRYILHTVGPQVNGRVTEEDERTLRSCYISCLELAAENGLESIAFCSISTGVFGFPGEKAARIAVNAVESWLRGNDDMKIVFDVFGDRDREIYEGIFKNM